MTTIEHDHPHSAPPSPYHRSERTRERNAELAQRVAKLESLLTAKGLVAKDALDKLVDLYEHDLGPMNGAKVVARAWVDADFKRRLLANATGAIAELGFGGLQGEHMVVVENTPHTHNVVVCTLCSCYPWPVLGLPPAWYKDAAYRSRIVHRTARRARANSARSSTTTSRCASGTAAPRFVISCCRSAPRARST